MSDAGAPTVGPDAGASARKEQLAQDLARAKDAGWNDRKPFQYDDIVKDQAGEDDPRDSGLWLSDAATYQWDDDFGDVGDANPELEKQLFHDALLQRAGGAIRALSFNITLEGPTKVHPVRDASKASSPLSWIANSRVV